MEKDEKVESIPENSPMFLKIKELVKSLLIELKNKKSVRDSFTQCEKNWKNVIKENKENEIGLIEISN